MSISDQIARINNEKLKVGNKLQDFGLITDPTVNLETLADTVASIPLHECPERIELSGEGQTFNIIAGYHKGSTVYWVQDTGSEAARYLLEDRGAITPQKGQDITVTVTDDKKYYGMSQVLVKAIPHPYYSVKDVDASVDDVLETKKFVDSSGVLQTGSMPKRNPLNITLNYQYPSQEVPYGFYRSETLGATGNIIGGTVSAPMEDEIREVTPTAGEQLIQPVSTNNYKFLKGVKVIGDSKLTSANIPYGTTIFGVQGNYTNDANIEISSNANVHKSPDVIKDRIVYANGKRVVGSMPVGTVDASIGKKQTNGSFSTQYVNLDAGYYSVISVSLSTDIETELAKI